VTRQEFTLDGMPVGVFVASAPHGAGEYRYEPYRGPGHYEMQERLRQNGSARCAPIGRSTAKPSRLV
jgi:hypothetical protein